MPNHSRKVKAAVEEWLASSSIPVTSAAYRLSDTAALALSTGYVDHRVRTILYARLQKGSTTPQTGGVEELRTIAMSANEWHDAANSDPTARFSDSKYLSDESKLMANDVRSALAHRRYRIYMGTLGARRRSFLGDSAFAKSWMGIREEKRNGIYLSAQQRNAIFDALCRCAVPTSVDYADKVGPLAGKYQLRTFCNSDLPEWALVAEQRLSNSTNPVVEEQISLEASESAALRQKESVSQTLSSLVNRLLGNPAKSEVPTGKSAEEESTTVDERISGLESPLDKVPRSLTGEAGALRTAVNSAVVGVSRAIAGKPVEDQSWTPSREQLLQVQSATLHFADSYDTALYTLGIVLDRLAHSTAWNGDALASQATSIDITSEVMEIAADICELRDVSTALRRRGLEHGVGSHNRIRELGEVWAELVDRVCALVGLADAVDIVDTELVRWSDYRSVDDLDDRIDNLVARSGFRTSSMAYDNSIREDIAHSGRVMATARSIIEQEIGALGRGTGH